MQSDGRVGDGRERLPGCFYPLAHDGPARHTRGMVTTAATVHGPWVESDWESGLIARVRQWWDTPIPDLPDAALALFLRQHIAVDAVLMEARRRLARGRPDDSELYDGELAEAVRAVTREPGPAHG